MSESPLIFVSHSSKDNDITKELCQALRAGGAGETGCDAIVDFDKLQDYGVLVDVDELQAGKPWPKQLHEWMARCHAAVLLLTSNAVKSPWVLKEATILEWRLSLDKNFRFFVVRFDDVSDSDLTAGGFDPLMLGEIQKLTVGDAAAIAAQVRKAIPPPNRTPFDSLCGALQDLVRHVGPDTLKMVAETIKVDPPHWRPDVDEKQQYVQAIAAKLLSEDLGGYEGVDGLVNDLAATTEGEYVQLILEIVAPHWVDAAAAGRLPSLAKRQPRRAIAMNGASVSDFTARMYVRRAYPRSEREEVLSVPGANSGDLVEHVTRELYWHAYRDERSPDSSEALTAKQIADVIKHFGRGQPRFFVVLAAPHPSGVNLTKLMADFPKLTFILWTGEELLDPEPEAVVCLKPEVDLDQEEKQQFDYAEAMRIIRRKR